MTSGIALEVEVQGQADQYRLLVTRNCKGDVLLLKGPKGFRLPSTSIRRSERKAEGLNRAMLELFGLRTLCLFQLDLRVSADSAETILFEVMEVADDESMATQGMIWRSFHEIEIEFFEQRCDQKALCVLSQKMLQIQRGTECAPFERPGWSSDLVMWVQKTLNPLGQALNGSISQLNCGPRFSLMRFETNGPAVWFKATGPPNTHELSLTSCLARLFPDYVPKLLAVHPRWNGWLSEEVEERPLDLESEQSSWFEAAHRLATLQVLSIGEASALLRAGSKDARTSRLRGLLPEFFETVADLMEKQLQRVPPPLSRPELHDLRRRIEAMMLELDGLGVPDALGHMDINPGNIFIDQGRAVFLDWAEGYVGPPFATFEYLRRFYRKSHDYTRCGETELIDQYRLAWGGVIASEAMRRGLVLSRSIAILVLATVGLDWQNSVGREDRDAEAFLRSLVRSMDRESHLVGVRGDD